MLFLSTTYHFESDFKNAYVYLKSGSVITFKKPITRIQYAILIAPFVVLGVATFFIVLKVIKTDREKIIELIHDGAEAVVSEDFKMLDKIISEKYYGSYADTEKSLFFRARHELNTVDITSVNIRGIDIEFASKVRANVTVRFEASGYIIDTIYNRIPFNGLAGTDGEHLDEAHLVCVKENNLWPVIFFELRLQ